MGRGPGAGHDRVKGTRGGMGRGKFYFEESLSKQSACRSPDVVGITRQSLRGKISREDLTTLARDFEEQLKEINALISKLEGSASESPGNTIVDPDRCISCGICEWACPNGAISIGGIACIDSTKCIGCGLCIDKCPQRALSLVKA